MSVYILIGIDPYSQPGIDKIKRVDSIPDAIKFIEIWIERELNKQTKFLSGVRGDIKTHIKNYIIDFEKYNELYFYGEYKKNTNTAYEYKWNLYIL